jgi:LmbE family N-acetylglucosaminyl deacetylase
MKIMAFGPHPDDVEFLCSGTLAKYRAKGHDVAIAVMTRGDVGSPSLSRDEIAAIREKEARAAAAIINAEFFWLGYNDEFLYDTPDVRRHLIDVIRQFGPDIVLCPDKDKDYLPDHVRTGQMVWDTHVMATVPLIPTQHPVCKRIHEIWYYDTFAAIGFEPEVSVDITEQWPTKARMLDCHESQNAWMKHLFDVTLTDNAAVQSRLRGFQSGCKYAECFRRAHMFPQPAAKEGLLPSGFGD